MNVLKEFISLTLENDEFEDLDVKWTRMAEDLKYKPLVDAVKNATNPKELAIAKRMFNKAIDSGNDISVGMWMSHYKKKKQELADIRNDEKRLANPSDASKEARMDRMLRMRDSSGKATPRKF